MKRTALVLAVLALLVAASATTAGARRAPTFNERVAVIRALPSDLRAYPAGCLQFAVAVSNNGRFALVTPEVLIPRPAPSNDPCLRYAGDGFFVLKKTGAWKVVYVGSDAPACSLGVPSDLLRCSR